MKLFMAERNVRIMNIMIFLILIGSCFACSSLFTGCLQCENFNLGCKICQKDFYLKNSFGKDICLKCSSIPKKITDSKSQKAKEKTIFFTFLNRAWM